MVKNKWDSIKKNVLFIHNNDVLIQFILIYVSKIIFSPNSKFKLYTLLHTWEINCKRIYIINYINE